MCGIVGFIDGKSPDKGVLQEMMNQIIHRGPDDSGAYLDERIALGHRRLSIIDLAGGTQPMKNEDGRLICIFNGEIYNFQKLKKELEANGHTFATDSDTEVLLHGYEQWGKDLPGKLRGMFAFAIWDRKKKELFCARDYFGIKPFYYYHKNDTFLFGSEIKSFLPHPRFEKTLNREQLELYLTYQYSPGEATFFEHVYKLLPAHFLLWKDGKIEITRYWQPEFACGDDHLSNRKMDYKAMGNCNRNTESEHGLKDKTIMEWQMEIDAVMRDSVEAHKISDVEVGSFLSSGVDSSYVTALAGVDKTFTVGYQHKAKDISRDDSDVILSNKNQDEECVDKKQIKNDEDIYVNEKQIKDREDIYVDEKQIKDREDIYVDAKQIKNKEDVWGNGNRKNIRSKSANNYQKYDESEYAHAFSKSKGIHNIVYRITPEEFWEKLPDIQYYMDEPLADAASVALYFLNREASRHVKVCLSGEGADELFGGYRIYKEPFMCASYEKVPLFIRRMLGAAAELLPPMPGVNFLVRHSRPLSQRYIGNTSLFTEKQKRKILKNFGKNTENNSNKNVEKVLENNSGESSERISDIHSKKSQERKYRKRSCPSDLSRPYFQYLKDADDVTRMQFTDLHLWLVGDILLKADKMSMANSLELRVPFLDKKVFEVARKIPTAYRVNAHETKIALRGAAKYLLGEENAKREKLGFPVPVREWLREDIYSAKVRKAFEGAAAKEFFYIKKLHHLLDDHISGKRDNWRQIWCVYMFLVWYEEYFVKR